MPGSDFFVISQISDDTINCMKKIKQIVPASLAKIMGMVMGYLTALLYNFAAQWRTGGIEFEVE